MTAVRRRAPVAELVHVSAGLREDGGGAAHFGRTLGCALRRFASRRGLAFRGLHLPASDGHPALDGYTSCGGGRGRFALALAAMQSAGAGARLLFFDHPGPARVQGWLPGCARSRYLVAALGIDVWRPFSRAQLRALRGASSVLAISDATIERARPFLPAGCRIDRVHPGIEPRHPGGEPDRRLLEELGEGFVLVVGRLAGRERYKGHDELLEALPEVARRFASVRLVIAGDGPDAPRLEQKARATGAADRVRFTGGVDGATLEALYHRCALFAMPSRLEGFGLVFVEAMAAGKACVALAGTAPAEIVVDGETGRLVPDGDPAALAAALVELLADPERARRLGEAGRARYEREFTFAAFERRLEPVLARLVEPGAD